MGGRGLFTQQRPNAAENTNVALKMAVNILVYNVWEPSSFTFNS